MLDYDGVPEKFRVGNSGPSIQFLQQSQIIALHGSCHYSAPVDMRSMGGTFAEMVNQ